MAGVAPANPKTQFTSTTGVPLVNGTLTVYAAGTTTPSDTWQDSALTVLNTNPITLDARGEALVWLDSAKTYKFLLKDAAGATAWTVDNIKGPLGGTDLTGSGGSLLVGHGTTTVGDRLNAVDLADYTALRAYAGLSKTAYITGYLVSAAPSGIAGEFTRDDNDTTTADNAGTVIVASNGKRWKRIFDGPIDVKWFGATGDGSTDDTTAIQAAINTGNSIYIPPGTYKTTSTLNLITVANHGQKITGAGPLALAGTGTNCTIIQPTAAVSTIFRLDGTPFSSWVQHVTIEDMTLDMANMTDNSSNYGVLQQQAWGCTYSNVRCINDGTNKRGFKFETGAYTTTVHQCTARIVDLVGASIADAVTTIQFYGCDLQHARLRGAVAIDFFGCTWQGALAKLDVDTIRDVNVFGGDMEGTGNIITVGSDVQGVSIYNPSTTGFSGTLCNGGSVIAGIAGYYHIETLAHGIHLFPGIRLQGSTSTLANYVENTAFTPVLEGSTSAGAGTYTTQSGEYTRVGKLVFFLLRLSWTAHTGTGNMRITGLPFTARNTVNVPTSISTDSLTYSNALRAEVIANTTRIDLISETSGAGQAAVAMDTAGTLNICGVYQV